MNVVSLPASRKHIHTTHATLAQAAPEYSYPVSDAFTVTVDDDGVTAYADTPLGKVQRMSLSLSLLLFSRFVYFCCSILLKQSN